MVDNCSESTEVAWVETSADGPTEMTTPESGGVEQERPTYKPYDAEQRSTPTAVALMTAEPLTKRVARKTILTTRTTNGPSFVRNKIWDHLTARPSRNVVFVRFAPGSSRGSFILQSSVPCFQKGDYPSNYYLLHPDARLS
jgi:hypothetical protein